MALFYYGHTMNTYNLIYLQTLKDAVGVEVSYTNQDEKLLRCISSATLTIQSMLGRNLSKNEYTEIKDSVKNYVTGFDIRGYSDSGIAAYSDPRAIVLKNFPVDEDADFKIYYDINGRFDESTLLADTDYSVDYDTGFVWLNISTYQCKRAIKVVYTAGYESATTGSETVLEASLPTDLVQAAIWQAQHVYDKNTSSNINSAYSASQGVTGSYRFINVAAIVPEAMAIVAQYRRPKVAVI
jgi:hypothetical protein